MCQTQNIFQFSFFLCFSLRVFRNNGDMWYQNCVPCSIHCSAEGERKSSQTLFSFLASNNILQVCISYSLHRDEGKTRYPRFLQNILIILVIHSFFPLSFLKTVHCFPSHSYIHDLPKCSITSHVINITLSAFLPPSLRPSHRFPPLLPLIHLDTLISHPPGNRHPRRHPQNTGQQSPIQLHEPLFSSNDQYGLEEPTVFRSGATGDFLLDLEAGLFGRKGGREGEKRGDVNHVLKRKYGGEEKNQTRR